MADFTRYDLTIGDQTIPKLYKRRLILQVVHEAIKRDYSPESIEDATGLKYLWISVDRELDRIQFIEAASKGMETQGKKFDGTRYFTAEQELIVFHGRTYALTTQWGLGNVFDAVKKVVELIGASADIRYAPSSA